MESSKSLILIRHGHAVDGSSSDFERPLSETGQNVVEKLAIDLAAGDKSIPIVICSTARRTRETLDKLNYNVNFTTTIFDEKVYFANRSDDLNEVLKKHLVHPAKSIEVDRNAHTVAIIGHNPAISLFAEWLSEAPCRMSPGDCLLLSIDATSWEEAIASRGLWQASGITSK